MHIQRSQKPRAAGTRGGIINFLVPGLKRGYYKTIPTKFNKGQKIFAMPSMLSYIWSQEDENKLTSTLENVKYAKNMKFKYHFLVQEKMRHDGIK